MNFYRKMLVWITALALAAGCAACSPAESGTAKPGETKGSGEAVNAPKDVSETAYGDGYNVNMLVGVDQFGRTFDITGGTKSDKKVGIFYWPWIGQPAATDVYDATKILKEYGKDVLFHETSSVSPDGQPHFWGEPLWGYYNSADEYVIRKQMELLTSAGIDFIAFDTTNAITYRNVYMKVAKIISELISDGWNPPRITFYTHSYSIDTVRKLYSEFYNTKKYPESWYMVDGKPMMIGYTDPELDKKAAASIGDTKYNPGTYTQKIRNFFTFRNPNWPGEYLEDGFPWCEWSYPQPVHGDMINVTVASHPMVPMSFSLTREGWKNWGRGYDPEKDLNISANAQKGTFFQKQWDVALAADPGTVFVGGWNEWIAYKQIYDGEYMLCDAASMEYSRDIEMMKGGYNDAFYIQLIKNVRAYKGLEAEKIDSGEKTIDVNGSPSQWDAISVVYRDIGKENYGRNYMGVTRKVKYTMEAPRNNLQTVKVTKDADNIYFMVESDADITENDGSGNWMNIFMTAGEVRNTGWVCYDYVINRSSENQTAIIEKLDADGNGTKVGLAKMSVQGKYMQLAIPRSAVGLQDGNTFYFKVADGVQHPEDIMDYYVTGRSLPMGRLSFKFVG